MAAVETVGRAGFAIVGRVCSYAGASQAPLAALPSTPSLSGPKPNLKTPPLPSPTSSSSPSLQYPKGSQREKTCLTLAT